MPKLVEINGLDEAGKVGEDIILVRVGVGLPSETYALLRNLEHFDRPIVGKNDLRGRERSNLLRYARDLIDDKSFDISIYRMGGQAQIIILRSFFDHLCKDLFHSRGILIDEIKRGSQTGVSEVIDRLRPFMHAPIYWESFVKSYALRALSKQLGIVSKVYTEPRDIDRLMVVQIDGGYPFAFWWSELMGEPNPVLKKGKVAITGVTSGDEYYPLISMAGALATILFQHPEVRHFFPINEVDKILSPEEKPSTTFYEGHKKAFSRPTYQDRVLLFGSIGESLRRCIPYVLHRGDRSRTYEPFQIQKSLENFLTDYGWGGPENTRCVYGSLISLGEKEDLKFARETGYPCCHVSELQEDFENVFSELESEIDLFPTDRRATLKKKLMAFRETCEAEWK